MNDLIAELSITAAATDAGDSLIVLVQHSLDHVAWGPYLKVVATPAGPTAAFTIGDLRIINS
jgi:hypothetical protein